MPTRSPGVAGCARKHGVAPSTALLGWSIQRGVPALPKSVTPSRIKSNNADEVYALALDENDLAQLRTLEDGMRFVAFFNHQQRR